MAESSNTCGRWSDWTNGSANWETFTVKELLPHVREHFNVGSDNPAEVAITGISSAGQGALRFGLKHPDVFGVVCGLSAAITPTAKAADLYLEHPNVPLSWANELVVFADKEGDTHALPAPIPARGKTLTLPQLTAGRGAQRGRLPRQQRHLDREQPGGAAGSQGARHEDPNRLRRPR